MPGGKGLPKDKKVTVKSDNGSTAQVSRGGPVLLNKLIPKGITQTIFRRNKNHAQVLQDTCESPTLPPIVHTHTHSSTAKNSHTSGSNNSLNQLTSPSLTSYQSSGYGSQPHSARPSLQEQTLPSIGGHTGTSWMDTSDRKFSVESGCGGSPCVTRRNGIRNSREENVKNARCHGNRKHIGSFGPPSPRSSQTQYQSPMTITGLTKTVKKLQENKDHKEQISGKTFVVVNKCRYQIAANGSVINEGGPVLKKKKKISFTQHKMSLQPRRPSQNVLPPIGSTRYSVPSSVSPRTYPNASLQMQPMDQVDMVAIVPKVSLSSVAQRTERKTSGENPMAVVTHRIPPVPPATPLLVTQEEADGETCIGHDDPDRPKSRRKNAVVSNEDKPDIGALLAAIPQIHLISPTPIPPHSQPPSVSDSTCTSPDS